MRLKLPLLGDEFVLMGSEGLDRETRFRRRWGKAIGHGLALHGLKLLGDCLMDHLSNLGLVHQLNRLDAGRRPGGRGRRCPGGVDGGRSGGGRNSSGQGGGRGGRGRSGGSRAFGTFLYVALF